MPSGGTCPNLATGTFAITTRSATDPTEVRFHRECPIISDVRTPARRWVYIITKLLTALTATNTELGSSFNKNEKAIDLTDVRTHVHIEPLLLYEGYNKIVPASDRLVEVRWPTSCSVIVFRRSINCTWQLFQENIHIHDEPLNCIQSIEHAMMIDAFQPNIRGRLRTTLHDEMLNVCLFNCSAALDLERITISATGHIYTYDGEKKGPFRICQSSYALVLPVFRRYLASVLKVWAQNRLACSLR